MKTIRTILVVFSMLASMSLFSQKIKGYTLYKGKSEPKPQVSIKDEKITSATIIQQNESEIQIPSDRKATIVFSESFSNNSLDNIWIPNPSTLGMSSFQDPMEGKVLKIENKDRNRTILLEYDLTKLVVGKHVKLSALIRHENIVAGSKPWEIGQLSIKFRVNEEKVYESVQDLIGSSDWSLHFAHNDGDTDLDYSEYGDYVFKVPDNASQVRLYLGLQNCTGTIYFKDLKVIVLE